MVMVLDENRREWCVLGTRTTEDIKGIADRNAKSCRVDQGEG